MLSKNIEFTNKADNHEIISMSIKLFNDTTGKRPLFGRD